MAASADGEGARAMTTRPDYPVPADKDDPRFHVLFDYWLGKCRGDRLPGRQHIDPIDLRDLLGRINLIEVERTPELRFRYRVWGSKVTEMVGMDYTGRYAGDLALPTTAERIVEALSLVVRRRAPHFWQVPVPYNDRGFISYRRLALPLASDGETVDMLVALLIEDEATKAEG